MIDLPKMKNWRTSLRRRETFPPDWFFRNDPAKIGTPTPNFLFQSWIPEHTDKLIHLLVQGGDIGFEDIKMFSEPGDKKQRVEIMRFAEEQKELYDRMVMHKLSPHRNTALGLVVTLDWLPAMRRLVYGASRLGFRTILVPHESVFAKESMYYTHPKMGVNAPLCDLVLAWGDIQEQIFIERGYPAERIIKVGAPKFDYLASDAVKIAEGAARSLGLDPNRPIAAFIAQPLDSQYDTRAARVGQNAAILDLISVAKSFGGQVIIRSPPSRDEILDAEVHRRVAADSDLVIDDAALYVLTAEETIAASDVVVSFNSTMLLEAALGGKVALTTKYIEFDQIWDKLKIPVVRNKAELLNTLMTAIRRPEEFVRRYDIAWAAKAFGVGEFDGRAVFRIQRILQKIKTGELDVKQSYAANHPELLTARANLR